MSVFKHVGDKHGKLLIAGKEVSFLWNLLFLTQLWPSVFFSPFSLALDLAHYESFSSVRSLLNPVQMKEEEKGVAKAQEKACAK